MKSSMLICFFALFHFLGYSQLKGVVYGSGQHEKKTSIPGARIKSLHSGLGTVTKSDGTFELTLGKSLPDTLIVSAPGYHNDTIFAQKGDRFALLEVLLFPDNLLPEAVATAKRETHSISKLKTLHVENIGEGELRKAACCNLSESFETNASVDVNMTDAISGAKKIQMMGLDGVYTQIQFENIPYLRGLESSFGMNAIPGTWIESIQITKGTGNVVNGYESMAGLVNLELKKPEEMEKFYFNAYGNIFGRAEVNVNGAFKLNEKWRSGYFAHAAGMFGEIDNNRDKFRDLPLSKNLSALNRWSYRGKNFESQFGVNAYYEEKTGGQTGYSHRSSNGLYGVFIENKHIDAFAKTGFLFAKKPYQSIGVVYNLKYQQTNALFGLRQFTGEEKRGYVNAIYDGIIGNTNHGIKAGGSLVYADIRQDLDSLLLDRVEIVPGIFAEYTYTSTRLTTVFGARGDFHNLYGFQFSPRFHSRLALTENLDLRITAGRGFRISNVIIDNISLLATSRDWIIASDIRPEISWNMGGSLVQDFKLKTRKATFSIDFYRTFFENQLVVDRDLSLTSIHFGNLTGKSVSNTLQAEVSLPVLVNLDVRFAYKYLDVQAPLGGQMQQQVMIPKHRGFMNLAYKTRNKRWEFDFTISVYGKSRLHHVHIPDSDVEYTTMSSVYPLMNAQITHIYKRWDFYIGGENLANYRQKNALIDPENPFGPYFDATRVWAPIQGTNIYAGIRYKLKQDKK